MKACLWCGHQSRTATDHGIHIGTAHADRHGVGVAAPAARTRRTWSCWACATENPPDVDACQSCGFTHPTR